MVVTVGPGHSLCAAARAMSERSVGAAVVRRSRPAGPGDPHRARHPRLARGRSGPRTRSRWRDHLSTELTFADPTWSLERAAEAMVKGGFRHLLVVDGGELTGMLTMRDIVHCWVQDGATSEMPGST